MSELEQIDNSKAVVKKSELRMDHLLDEGLTSASEVIEKIRKADRLAVIYRRTPESVDIGVFDPGTSRFDAVNLKSLLGLANREIEFEWIFAEERGETPFVPGGQQRIADLFGKPVEFMQRYGGMEKYYLKTGTWETFEPHVQ